MMASADRVWKVCGRAAIVIVGAALEGEAKGVDLQGRGQTLVVGVTLAGKPVSMVCKQAKKPKQYSL